MIILGRALYSTVFLPEMIFLVGTLYVLGAFLTHPSRSFAVGAVCFFSARIVSIYYAH